MSLATPDKIRTLQRKLYSKAKAEPGFRFYLLYDKICREDILRHAHAVARSNAGAAGVDGVSFGRIEAQGVEAGVGSLREELVTKRYQPQTCRGRSQSPVVWIAEVMETETLKPIDKVSPGEATSHRAVQKVNALGPRKGVS